MNDFRFFNLATAELILDVNGFASIEHVEVILWCVGDAPNQAHVSAKSCELVLSFIGAFNSEAASVILIEVVFRRISANFAATSVVFDFHPAVVATVVLDHG